MVLLDSMHFLGVPDVREKIYPASFFRGHFGYVAVWPSVAMQATGLTRLINYVLYIKVSKYLIVISLLKLYSIVSWIRIS